jgi:arginine decarboxylase
LSIFAPRMMFFTKGMGAHKKEELHSFELALRDAGIEKCNLVQVSSILPPHCKIISRTQGLKSLQPGAITYCVMSRCCSNEPRRLMAASDSWDEKKETFKISGKIVGTRNITQSSIVKNHWHTTVIAAAVFVLENDH